MATTLRQCDELRCSLEELSHRQKSDVYQLPGSPSIVILDGSFHFMIGGVVQQHRADCLVIIRDLPMRVIML